MTIISDVPSCGRAYDCHPDNSSCVICAPRVIDDTSFIVQVSLVTIVI
jgi:hypothetical protein